MNSVYLDANFEIDKPEILVYSPNPASGQMQLVAVEYAIPNSEPSTGRFYMEVTMYGITMRVLDYGCFMPGCGNIILMEFLLPMNPNVH
ncbi:MAG: hypothetical protein MZV64_45730 [Ignavibacteriales bacterium]|nr:hypothetical protein [Ignavibacteriales bacterium]